MKRIITAILIIAVIVSLSSCSILFPKSAVSPSTVTDQATEPAESAAEVFLKGEPSVSEFGPYIMEKASGLSPRDADLLLERLLLLQLDVSEEMNSKIWNKGYMNELNDTLGGMLDAQKIQNIADKTVRNDFQEAADGLMTVVLYEEMPVFETDWAALESIKGAFSSGAAAMIDYQSRPQGMYYYGDLYNFDLMAADIAAVETELKNAPDGFVRWRLKDVYGRQVSRMLYGPEGSYFDMFMSGDAQIVSNIKKYAAQYTDSSFGHICKQLIAMQGGDAQKISDFISDSLLLPPGDHRTVTIEASEEDGVSLSLPVISGLASGDAENKINKSVSDTAKGMTPDGTGQMVSGVINFINSNYLSVTISVSYTDISGELQYNETNLSYDLSTGEKLTLEALTGKTFDAYKDLLVKSMHGEKEPGELTAPVCFFICDDGIQVLLPSDSGKWPDHYFVTLGGLRTFMDVSKLY